ncbi:MAG: archease [Thermodesulfobacteriota bacterium]
MPYQLIDHTADLGIKASGATLAELFETTAAAMFDQIVETRQLKGLARTRVDVVGIDREDLMISWLRELLFLWNGREMLVKRIAVKTISETAVSAGVTYDPYDPQKHEILTDIKAVTYHAVRVEKSEAGWEATVIFDV